MFHVKLLPQDLKEKAKLERRRMIEEERKKRIFNPKQRLIGIDKLGIRRQIEDKTREQEMEEAIEKKYYNYEMSALKAADYVEKQINQERKKFNEELCEYWNTYQRKEDRLEYALTKQLKLVDNERELGISSGQVFEGEDHNRHKRKALQIEQQRNWLFQQIFEKKQTEEEKKLAAKVFADCIKSRECRANYLENLENDCRKQIHIATQAYNEALAREYNFNKNVRKERETNDKLMEIFNAINSDLLTENPEVSQSTLGQNKVIQYQYKGMSEEERRNILKIQSEQIELNKIKMAEESNFNKKWENYYKSANEESLSRAALQSIKEREQKRTLMEENLILSEEKKFWDRYHQRKAASDFSTPEFLNKFNQSSR